MSIEAGVDQQGLVVFSCLPFSVLNVTPYGFTEGYLLSQFNWKVAKSDGSFSPDPCPSRVTDTTPSKERMEPSILKDMSENVTSRPKRFLRRDHETA